jgi:hypothetical protein
MALLGTLFYSAGQFLPEPPQPLPSRHDESNVRLAYVMFLPAFAGAGTLVLLFALARLLGVARAASATAVVMIGLGTVHWKYSSVLFSHALSGLLVALALYLTVRITRGGRAGPGSYGLLGLVLGASVLVEYSNALLVFILVAYHLIQGRPWRLQKLAQSFVPLMLGGLPAALFLAYYNYANFGSPLRLSYAYAINYPWASSFTTTFSFPLAAGLKGLLIGGVGDGWCGGPCINQGVLQLSPYLLFALPGWLLFYRRARPEAMLTAVIFLVYLLLFAQHRTFHGFTGDGRYLAPFLSLLALPLAYAVQGILAISNRPLQLLLLAALFSAFLYSVRSMFLHIGTSYNYALDPALLGRALREPGAGITALAQLFRNAGNLPLLWLIEGGFAILLVGMYFAQQGAQRRRQDSSG